MRFPNTFHYFPTPMMPRWPGISAESLGNEVKPGFDTGIFAKIGIGRLELNILRRNYGLGKRVYPEQNERLEYFLQSRGFSVLVDRDQQAETSICLEHLHRLKLLQSKHSAFIGASGNFDLAEDARGSKTLVFAKPKRGVEERKKFFENSDDLTLFCQTMDTSDTVTREKIMDVCYLVEDLIAETYKSLKITENQYHAVCPEFWKTKSFQALLQDIGESQTFRELSEEDDLSDYDLPIYILVNNDKDPHVELDPQGRQPEILSA